MQELQTLLPKEGTTASTEMQAVSGHSVELAFTTIYIGVLKDFVNISGGLGSILRSSDTLGQDGLRFMGFTTCRTGNLQCTSKGFLLQLLMSSFHQVL